MVDSRTRAAATKGQSAPSEGKPKDAQTGGEPTAAPGPAVGVRRGLSHITHYTPLHDSVGIITPAALHFMQTHANRLPDIDPQEYRLTIHGMVDRPLSFTLEELKRCSTFLMLRTAANERGDCELT